MQRIKYTKLTAISSRGGGFVFHYGSGPRNFVSEPYLAYGDLQHLICNPRNERLMMDIIELLIPGKHLSGITFIEKEKHGLVVTEKSTNFDLLCKEKDTGEEFLVELQNRFQDSNGTTKIRQSHVYGN